VQLALTVARESGKGNEVLGFWADGAIRTVSFSSGIMFVYDMS